MESSLLDDLATWPAAASELAEQIAGRGVRLEDLNLGLAGADSRDQIALFSQYLVPSKPEVLVLSVGINDLWLQLDRSYNSYRQEDRSYIKLSDWATGSKIFEPFYFLRLWRLQKDGDIQWSWFGPKVRYRVGDFIKENHLLCLS